MKSKQFAFTLIELLIVVAIIGILAAIAVPNFLNAQIRAKIARVESDMRSLATAFESYRLDRNDYPHIFPPNWMDERYIPLTTPVSYMSAIPKDPFNTRPLDTTSGPKDSSNRLGSYDYWTRLAANGNTKGGNYWGAVTAFPKTNMSGSCAASVPPRPGSPSWSIRPVIRKRANTSAMTSPTG